jgi:hypothetical protein
MFLAAILAIAENVNNNHHSKIADQINKSGHIHSRKYFEAVNKMNQV